MWLYCISQAFDIEINGCRMKNAKECLFLPSPFRFSFEMRIKLSNFMNSLSTNLTPPKIQSLPKFLA